MGACVSKQEVKNQPNAKQEQLKEQPIVDTADLNQLPMEGRISDAKVKDRYLFGDQLGGGVYSVVQYATDKRIKTHYDDAKYAIKIMKLIGRTQGNNPTVTRRGEVGNQIRILMSLQHQNVLAMREYYEENDQVYMVTEHLSGGELLSGVCEYIERKGYREIDAQVCLSRFSKA